MQKNVKKVKNIFQFKALKRHKVKNTKNNNRVPPYVKNYF